MLPLFNYNETSNRFIYYIIRLTFFVLLLFDKQSNSLNQIYNASLLPVRSSSLRCVIRSHTG
jgi:hypothetical protein